MTTGVKTITTAFLYFHQLNQNRCLDRYGKCAKGFPKPLQPSLSFNADTGYPEYKREGPADQHVVPHVRELLLFWQGHINVEYCASSLMPVYLYKYLFKGPEKARYRVIDADEQRNEFLMYYNGRYISAMEATWFTFGRTTFPPSVPGVHQLNLIVGEASETRNGSSMLSKYFKRPDDDQFNGLRYNEFFELYNVTTQPPANRPADEYHSFIVGSRTYYCWKPSRTRGCIRFYRIVNVYSASGEIFYVRLLLLHRPTRSLRDLRTMRDAQGQPTEVHQTFQQAAQALGLIEDADETFQTLRDTLGNISPRSLRRMFSCMTVHGFPTAVVFYDNDGDNDVMRCVPCTVLICFRKCHCLQAYDERFDATWLHLRGRQKIVACGD